MYAGAEDFELTLVPETEVRSETLGSSRLLRLLNICRAGRYQQPPPLMAIVTPHPHIVRIGRPGSNSPPFSPAFCPRASALSEHFARPDKVDVTTLSAVIMPLLTK